MAAVPGRRDTIGLEPDDIAFNNIVIAVLINDDTGKTIVTDNIPLVRPGATDLQRSSVSPDRPAAVAAAVLTEGDQRMGAGGSPTL